MSERAKVTRVAGRPIPLRGNDIDTDQIIPARFMKAITFDGLGQYAFHDQRFDADGSSKGHVIDDPKYRARGPRVAVVNKNFGCGSSREHAPQALLRWGVKALVGESFADIFAGNCTAMGIPCAIAEAGAVNELQGAIEADPSHDLVVDLEASTVTYGDRAYPVRFPAGARTQLLAGTWDATAVLLEAREQTRQTAARLPYVAGFRS